MKKLALSVVVLMVAGAGVSMTSVGCSSSSSTGTSPGEDSGADVTTPEDGGSDTGSSSGGDTGTPPGDSGADTGMAACDVDAAGSIEIDTPDGGMNTACESCLATNCAQEQCVCLTDTNMAPLPDDAGNAPACGVYVGCLYSLAEQSLAANPDAGVAGLSAQLSGFEATCGTGLMSSSTTSGNGLVGCFVNFCGSTCF